MLINLGFEASLQEATDKPFDTGFQSGLCGRTFFECPYDHKSTEGPRLRHDWPNGYLTALAQESVPFPF